MCLRVREAEHLFLPEEAVVEPGWLDRVAQEEKAEEEEVPEKRWKRKVEVQQPDLHHWEHPGITTQVVGAEVLLLLQSLVLVVKLQL